MTNDADDSDDAAEAYWWLAGLAMFLTGVVIVVRAAWVWDERAGAAVLGCCLAYAGRSLVLGDSEWE